MNNALHFTKTGDSLLGVEGQHMYLGQTFIDLGTGDADADLTAALRDFNLPTAIAPGDWRDACPCCPNVVEQIKRWEMQQPLT